MVSSLSLFLSFSAAQVLVGLRKQFMNNFVFPTLACAAGFNNNDNNNIATVLLRLYLPITSPRGLLYARIYPSPHHGVLR